jgi:hypothetical protein
MNFLRYTIISKILTKYRSKREFYNHEGFLYFDTKVGNINRIGKGFLYCEEEIIHQNWDDIDSNELFQVLKLIKNNQFYFFKTIDGKTVKFRPKKKNVKTKLP